MSCRTARGRTAREATIRECVSENGSRTRTAPFQPCGEQPDRAGGLAPVSKLARASAARRVVVRELIRSIEFHFRIR